MNFTCTKRVTYFVRLGSRLVTIFKKSQLSKICPNSHRCDVMWTHKSFFNEIELSVYSPWDVDVKIIFKLNVRTCVRMAVFFSYSFSFDIFVATQNCRCVNGKLFPSRFWRSLFLISFSFHIKIDYLFISFIRQQQQRKCCVLVFLSTFRWCATNKQTMQQIWVKKEKRMIIIMIIGVWWWRRFARILQ